MSPGLKVYMREKKSLKLLASELCSPSHNYRVHQRVLWWKICKSFIDRGGRPRADVSICIEHTALIVFSK